MPPARTPTAKSAGTLGPQPSRGKGKGRALDETAGRLRFASEIVPGWASPTPSPHFPTAPDAIAGAVP